MKKIYFASDFHLGVDSSRKSRDREKVIVQWLDSIGPQAECIYLLGDVVDYWFEYRAVVPKGFVRLFGKLAELSDKGVDIQWITGNHDMWTFGYLSDELGVSISHKPLKVIHFGKNFFLAHGDGLGKNQGIYKWIKALFANKICQSLFALLPTSVGLWLMHRFSKSSRINQIKDEHDELLRDEQLIAYCNDLLDSGLSFDFYIFGHRHRPQVFLLADGRSKFVNLGDWTEHFTFGVLDPDGSFELKTFDPILS